MTWVHWLGERHAVAFRLTRLTRTTSRCRFRVHFDPDLTQQIVEGGNEKPAQQIAPVSQVINVDVISVPVDRAALERVAAERFPGRRIELLWETPSIHRSLIEPLATLQTASKI